MTARKLGQQEKLMPGRFFQRSGIPASHWLGYPKRSDGCCSTLWPHPERSRYTTIQGLQRNIIPTVRLSLVSEQLLGIGQTRSLFSTHFGIMPWANSCTVRATTLMMCHLFFRQILTGLTEVRRVMHMAPSCYPDSQNGMRPREILPSIISFPRSGQIKFSSCARTLTCHL